MKKILLAVNAEYGQANVFLAVGHALQALDPSVQIHFVSFAAISNDVSAASAYSVQCTPGAQPWTFHLLDGPSFMQAIRDKDAVHDIEGAIQKRPGFFSTIEVLSKMMHLLMPWDGPEFVQIYKSFVRVVDEVQPDIIAVDSLFAVATTACRHLKLNHLILSPNTLKDFAASLQPRGAMLWKFPVMGSAFEFPVPLRSIPANVFFVFCQIYYVLTDTKLKGVAAYVKRELGAQLTTFQDLMMAPIPGQKVLVANRPEIEYPLVVPPHLTACGPVMRPVPAVADIDPELAAWLRHGPTVFISLGTHRFMLEDEALEMAGAIQQLFDAAEARKEGAGGGVGGVPGKLQVLWKLKRDRPGDVPTYETGPGTKVYKVLEEAMEEGRVRIVDWVKPQPTAILQTGTVVCSVSHGGANSFNDALTCGIPQLVIPGWVDCYDFAGRAEFLGIGRWANKQAMPKCTAREVGPILIDVVLGPKAQAMRTRVQELAALCEKTPGASVAAAAILEVIEDSKTK
ncbi:glycosyltransferase [Parachaetomium inaequale]|uniref:Glycosyltransferase n=1 Tax=Parachaetomium inaequale TaxID=2588326 RepID=A0AAN6SLS1_9PEZI|nr:glycosyltransferase [Parachaetomium inaequale]